ncbi:zinc finger protein 335 isoform X2 [Pseudophryne corroboree]|uniref:zinc finger protein 335 isoform X2 n=1 Tax=Pseudophryne corroboree TaxID=495146 RepID=UPI0030817DF4
MDNERGIIQQATTDGIQEETTAALGTDGYAQPNPHVLPSQETRKATDVQRLALNSHIEKQESNLNLNSNEMQTQYADGNARSDEVEVQETTIRPSIDHRDTEGSHEQTNEEIDRSGTSDNNIGASEIDMQQIPKIIVPQDIVSEPSEPSTSNVDVQEICIKHNPDNVDIQQPAASPSRISIPDPPENQSVDSSATVVPDVSTGHDYTTSNPTMDNKRGIIQQATTDGIQEETTAALGTDGYAQPNPHVLPSQETRKATDVQRLALNSHIEKQESNLNLNSNEMQTQYADGNARSDEVEVQETTIRPSIDHRDTEGSHEQTNEEIDRSGTSDNNIGASEIDMQQIPKIIVPQDIVSEPSEPSTSNVDVQEICIKHNPDNVDIQQPAASPSRISIPDPPENQSVDSSATVVPDVSTGHDYTEAISNAQMLACQPDSCSVPGVCSICQSLLTQNPRSVLLPSEVSVAAYSANSAVDQIIHGSINPQLIQGCIVTSTEGRNSEITQYLILQEPEGASTNYPMTVGSIAAGEMPPSRSSGVAETLSDLEALEGMMEVVVVQQYKCKMCQYKSVSKSTLLRHVKERHMKTVSKDEKESRKMVRPREEEEEDDIVDAGAIDDPDGDSDYSPGEDVTRNHQFISVNGALAKERPRRRPGRPRKVPRIQGPELDSGPPPMSTTDNQAEINIILSDLENKDPSSCPPQEEQKPPTRPRGRPPKHFRGRKYHRYRGRRYYKPQSKPLLRPFICRVCGSRFLTQQDYTFHVNSHDGNEPQIFRCQQCNYQCRRWSSLKEHMFKHQGSKPHKCDQCEYTSVYKKDVIRHSAVHQQERKKKPLLTVKSTSYPCPVCNRVYNMQKRLTQHMKTHSSEKPHMCDKCGKAFKKRYTFKMHLLTHLHCVDENRYKCEFCEYMCEDRKQLLSHQLTHMNDKPFECNQCKYHTFRQDFLLSHQATKHAGGKPFACDYCHFSTKHKKNLRLHVQCKHAHLYQEWFQRHPEETPCRRRPFFSLQQIEELKQLHEHSEAQGPSEQGENPPRELTYHMLHQPSQEEGQAQNTMEAATIIYEQGGEGDELATQAALDLLLNMSNQRDGSGGALQVAVVKSAPCMDSHMSEVTSQEPHMAQVLTLHMDERQVTDVQEVGYEETGIPDTGYDGTVQQITINAAYSTAEYNLINAERMQTQLCSDNEASPRFSQTLLAENGKDKNALQILNKPQQPQNAPNPPQPPSATKKFSCKICNSAFWGRAEMESHKRSHVEGGSGFKCPDCEFGAETWPEIRDHMSLHSDLRPHRCTQCSFASRNKKDLSRHAMTHTNHRPHSCHLCGQRFNRKGHLKFHIQRLHTGANMEQPEQNIHLRRPWMKGTSTLLRRDQWATRKIQLIFRKSQQLMDRPCSSWLRQITRYDTLFLRKESLI